MKELTTITIGSNMSKFKYRQNDLTEFLKVTSYDIISITSNVDHKSFNFQQFFQLVKQIKRTVQPVLGNQKFLIISQHNFEPWLKPGFQMRGAP